jgi:sugar/nucleoside kinase (ribokinase family)
MAALFEDKPEERFTPESLEKYALVFAQHLSDPTSDQSAVVIRAGKHGSLTAIGSDKVRWLPAFYHDPSPRIVDPTGAGNTFLGGFLAGWQRTHNVEEASVWGNVAASLALEQTGLPSRRTEEGLELWNETSIPDRLQEYKARIGFC